MISHRHNIVAEWDVPKEDSLHDGTKVRYYGFLIETKQPTYRPDRATIRSK